MNHHPAPGGRCCSAGPSRVLLPRIMASGREWLRRWCTIVEVTDMDRCAPPPYTLIEVMAGEPHCCYDAGCCHLVIPLLCRLRDSRGCVHTGKSQLTIDVPVRLNYREAENWRYQWLAMAGVRLVCQPPCSHDLRFEAALEVCAEAYLVKWEVCSQGESCRPACPPLPLYPPPCEWERP